MDNSLTLHKLFEQQAAKNPQTPALILGKEVLNYAELNAKSNQLAHYLRERGLKVDTPVAVCFERSFEFIIAILGILKAGGAYIPLDPSNPAERLLLILKEAGQPY